MGGSRRKGSSVSLLKRSDKKLCSVSGQAGSTVDVDLVSTATVPGGIGASGPIMYYSTYTKQQYVPVRCSLRMHE
jgi:hypothetical protein